jgi:methyltransferase family protein
MSTEGPQSELPPQIVLYHLATGHYLSHALQLAVKLGIADLLQDGPRQATELAQATGTHAPSLNRVLRLLVSGGVFEERENGSIALTRLGDCLRAGVPGSARAMVMLFAGERIQNAWQELEYCVRTSR